MSTCHVCFQTRTQPPWIPTPVTPKPVPGCQACREFGGEGHEARGSTNQRITCRPKSKGPAQTPPPNATWKPQELGDEIGDLRPAMIGVSWWLIIPKNKAAYFFGQTWHCNGGVPLDSHSTTGDLGFVAKKIIGQFMFP